MEAHIEDCKVCKAGESMNNQSEDNLQLPHSTLRVLQAFQYWICDGSIREHGIHMTL